MLTGAVINSTLTLAKSDVPLHRGMVAVTGGRGTGKTAFVDLIANCFAEPVDKQTDDSFVKRIASDFPELTTSIEFTGAESFTKSVDEKDRAINKADLAYISQGQLADYIDDYNELTKRIKELLFGEATQVLEYEFQGLSDKTKEIENRITAYSTQIINLEIQTSDKVTVELETGRTA